MSAGVARKLGFVSLAIGRWKRSFSAVAHVARPKIVSSDPPKLNCDLAEAGSPTPRDYQSGLVQQF